MKKYNNIQVINNRSFGNSFDPYVGKTIKSNISGPSKFVKSIAEKQFLRRVYTGSRSVKQCQIPSDRANFLIVFSPDGSKLASTNGDRNVYVIQVATHKVLNTLRGHERTLWTVAFHPTDNNILAIGCRKGEVRVWNLIDNSFKCWCSPSSTDIESVAFHPKCCLLAIATCKDVYFWDWNTSFILGQTSTENVEEKISYIKFDSTGDKLITAIALKSTTLSQYDSVTFREVYQFSCERRILKDVKVIMKFCENIIHQNVAQNCNLEESLCSKKKPRCNRPNNELSLLGEILPYLCKFHVDLVVGYLNVSCFCPAEFSSKALETLKKNTLPFDHLVHKCYFCRYTWLYNAVFQLRIMSQHHICKEICRFTKDDHIWSFSDCRSEELVEENTNEINGVTEKTLRFCFEQFAKTRIAPHFAELLPEGGLCSKHLKSEKTAESSTSSSKKPSFHEVPLRSDCFLNSCEAFKLVPRGTFISFLTSFVKLYHYLPALLQISAQDDRTRLNAIMNEWEYLYCKLLLINNIIEGDDGLILKKRSVKTTNENVQLNPRLIDDNSSNIHKEKQDSKKRLFREKQNHSSENKEDIVNEGASTSNFPMHYQALQLLRKDVDILTNEILRRNESKAQRCRMEKLYKQQLEMEINSSDGALFISFQIIKKYIRLHLFTFISELKKFLKVNLTNIQLNDVEFYDVYMRLLIFIVKRVVTFIRSILEFLCDCRYGINELFEISSDAMKAASTSYHSSPLRVRQIYDINFRRDFHPDTDDPVFDEESFPYSSELSDDESNVNVPENILSGTSDHRFDVYVAQSSRPGPSDQSADLINSRWLKDHTCTFPKKVITSHSYLKKHLRLLKYASDRRHRDDSSVSRYEVVVQNVNRLLYYHLRYDAEQNSEYHSSHPLHRLQVWDFSQMEMPDISNRYQNIVVSECKVHNDATISISHDENKIAVLLSSNQYDQPDWLGVFSLEWKTLGQILCSVALNQVAVSLSFSPTSEYLAVGFSFMYLEDLKMADIISVQQEIDNWRDFNLLKKRSPIATSLIDITYVYRTDFNITVNCIRWSPVPGQGLIFGNSFGEIKFVV